jgi:hypothetical protein
MARKSIVKARTLTTIHQRYAADHQRPCEEENEGLWQKVIGINGAIILIYVVTIQRYNILCVETV